MQLFFRFNLIFIVALIFTFSANFLVEVQSQYHANILGNFDGTQYSNVGEIPFESAIDAVYGSSTFLVGHKFDGGMLGFGTSAIDQYLPNEVHFDIPTEHNLPGVTFKKMAFNNHFSLGLSVDGNLFVSGTDITTVIDGNTHGVGSLYDFSGKKIVDIALDENHAAILDEDGEFYTSGSGGPFSPLCSGNQDGRSGFQATSKSVYSSQRRFHFLAISSNASLVIDNLGIVHGCGSNIGLGTGDHSYIVQPISHIIDKPFTQVAVSDTNAYFLCSNGSLFSSGIGRNFMTGIDNEDDKLLIEGPLQHGTLFGNLFTMIVAMKGSAAALDTNGNVHFWGLNVAIHSAPTIPLKVAFPYSGYIASTGSALISIPSNNVCPNARSHGLNTNCINCEDGMFCPTNKLQLPCPYGTWRTGIATECSSISCEFGHICKINGMHPCPSGSHCFNGIVRKCVGSKYSIGGASVCSTCTNGRIASESIPGQGNDACDTCPSGSVCDGQTSTPLCSRSYEISLYVEKNGELISSNTHPVSGKVLAVTTTHIFTSTSKITESSTEEWGLNVQYVFSGASKYVLGTDIGWKLGGKDFLSDISLDITIKPGFLGDMNDDFLYLLDENIIMTVNLETLSVENTKVSFSLTEAPISLYYNPVTRGILLITTHRIYSIEYDLIYTLHTFDNSLDVTSFTAFNPGEKIYYTNNGKLYSLAISTSNIMHEQNLAYPIEGLFYIWKSENCGKDSYCRNNGNECIEFKQIESWCNSRGCGEHGYCSSPRFNGEYISCNCFEPYAGEFCNILDCSQFGGNASRETVMIVDYDQLLEMNVDAQERVIKTIPTNNVIVYNGAVFVDSTLFRWEVDSSHQVLYKYDTNRITNDVVYREKYFSSEGQQDFEVLSITYQNGYLYTTVLGSFRTKLHYFQSRPNNQLLIEKFFVKNVENVVDGCICGNYIGYLYASPDDFSIKFWVKSLGASDEIDMDLNNVHGVSCYSDGFQFIDGTRIWSFTFEDIMRKFNNAPVSSPSNELLYKLYNSLVRIDAIYTRKVWADDRYLYFNYYLDQGGFLTAAISVIPVLRTNIGFEGKIGIKHSEGSFCNSNGNCQALSDQSTVCDCNMIWDEGLKRYNPIDCSFMQCAPNYFGEHCNEWNCYDISKEANNTCNGHGDCIMADTCVCYEDWHGLNCSVPTCWGIPGGTFDICSKHGTCVDINVCACIEGYSGVECEFPICTSGCGTGTCISPETCSCTSEWRGPACEFPVCHNKYLPDEVCTGHGTCASPDSCICDPGYTGVECAEVMCDNVPASDHYVCSGNGECTDVNFCTCANQYSGSNCEIYNCFGVPNSDENVCNKGGICSSVDNCECFEGYSGDECEFHYCDGVLSNEKESVCSGKGECLRNLTCQCNPNYVGEYCQFKSCFGKSEKSLDVCSGHGICVDIDNCACIDNYEGTTCENYSCYNTSVHNPLSCGENGNCIAHDTCDCHFGWAGETCDYLLCFEEYLPDRVCSGHGTCSSYNNCTCDDGYIGEECQYPLCDNLPSNETLVCSSRGECVLHEVCTCNDGYSGSYCEEFPCFYYNYDDDDVCSGHGICSSKDTCECDTNYHGDMCEYPTCYGEYSPDLVCSQHGTCEGLDICVCQVGYAGNKCELATCFGVVNTSSSVCGGNGECVDYNECHCYGTFANPDCTGTICNDELNPLLQCSGHGTCQNNGVCLCNADYSGTLCDFNIQFLLNTHTDDIQMTDVELKHSISLSIPATFKIFGESYSRMKISTRGAIAFGNSPVTFDLPLDPLEYTQINNTSNPTIYFGYTSSDLRAQTPNSQWNTVYHRDMIVSDLSTITTFVQEEFQFHPTLSSFSASWGYVVTMDHIGYYPNSLDLLNSCQVILVVDTATDISLVIMQYPYDGIQHPEFHPIIGFSSSSDTLDLMEFIDSETRRSSYVRNSTNGITPGVYSFITSSPTISLELGETFTCNSIPSTSPNVCSSRGKCVGYNKCVCDHFSGGTDCEIECSTDGDWSGPLCDKPRCFGLAWNESLVCSGHGACGSPNNCDCLPNYSGADCSNITCFGVASTDEGVCGGHGDCVSLDTCLCNEGWAANSSGLCAIEMCFGKLKTDPSPCPNHGICDSPNYCSNCFPFLPPTCLEATRYVSQSNGNDIDNDCLYEATPCKTLSHALKKLAYNNVIVLMGGTYMLPNYATYIRDSFTILGVDNATITTSSNHAYNSFSFVVNIRPNVKISLIDINLVDIRSRALIRSYYTRNFELVLNNVVISNSYSVLDYIGDGYISISVANVTTIGSKSDVAIVAGQVIYDSSHVKISNFTSKDSIASQFNLSFIYQVLVEDVTIENCTSLGGCFLQGYWLSKLNIQNLVITNSSSILSTIMTIQDGENISIVNVDARNVETRGNGLLSIRSFKSINLISIQIDNIVSQLNGAIGLMADIDEVFVTNLSYRNSICASFGGFYTTDINHITVEDANIFNVTAKAGTFIHGTTVFNLTMNNILATMVLGQEDSEYLSGEGALIRLEGNGAFRILNSIFSEGYSVFYTNGGYFIHVENVTVSAFMAGAFQITENSSPMITFKNSDFFNNTNTIGFGGVISVLESQGLLTIYSCQFNNSSSVNGGAIFAIEINRLLILNSTFSSSNAIDEGGAIYTEDINLFEIFNSTFDNNTAVYGGALVMKKIVSSLYFLKYGGAYFQQVHFRNNIAEQGGALYLAIENILQIKECEFIENFAHKSGGAILVEGTTYANSLDIEGGQFSFSDSLFSNPKAGLVVNDTLFEKNRVTEKGGSFSSFSNSVIVTFSSCRFLDNSAEISGGTMFLFVQSAEIINSEIDGSFAENGGAIFVFLTISSSGVLMDGLIVNNSTTRGQGVIYLSPNVQCTLTNSELSNNMVQNGAIYVDNANLVINSTTFNMNSASRSGGVFYVIENGYITCDSCEFHHNSAVYGGIVYLDTFKRFALSTATAFNNSADYGGSFYFGALDVIITSTNFSVENSIFEDRAIIAGGSFFTTVSDGNPPDFSVYMSNVSLESSAQVYGDNFATNPIFINITRLSTNSIYSEAKSISLYPGQSFSVETQIFDSYNQIVTYYPGLTVSLLTNFTLFGTLQQSIIHASATFEEIILYGKRKSSQAVSLLGNGIDISLISDSFQVTLIDCPLGYRYSFGEIYDSCVKCTKGSYSIIPSATECYFNCAGFKCYGGYTITYDKGYWIQALPDGSLRSLPCLNGHCIGGEFSFLDDGVLLPFLSENRQDLHEREQKFNMTIAQSPVSVFEATEILGISEDGTEITGVRYIGASCKGNRKGILCAECLDGYEPFKGNCVPCEGTNLFLIFFHIGHLLLMALYIHFSSQTVKGSAATRILISFMQTSMLTIDFSRWSAKNNMETLGVFGEMLKSFFMFQLPSFGGEESESPGLLDGCPFPRPGYWIFGYELLNFFLYLVVIVFAGLLAVCCCWPLKLHSMSRKKKKVISLEDGGLVSLQEWDPDAPPNKSLPQKVSGKLYTYLSPSSFVRSSLNIIIFSFQPLTNLTMSYLLSCFSLVGGDYVMINYTNLQCWTNTSYWLWSLIFIPVLGLIVFGPTLITILLFLNKKRLHNPNFRRFFGILYDIYKPEFFWFEWVFMTKRVLLIVSTIVSQMLTISYAVDGVQYIFYSLIIVFTYIFILKYSPYKSPGDNSVERFSLLISLLIIAVQEGATLYTESIGMILGMLFIILCLIVIILYVIFGNAALRKLGRIIVSKLCTSRSKESSITEIAEVVINELPRARSFAAKAIHSEEIPSKMKRIHLTQSLSTDVPIRKMQNLTDTKDSPNSQSEHNYTSALWKENMFFEKVDNTENPFDSERYEKRFHSKHTPTMAIHYGANNHRDSLPMDINEQIDSYYPSSSFNSGTSSDTFVASFTQNKDNLSNYTDARQNLLHSTKKEKLSNESEIINFNNSIQHPFSTIGSAETIFEDEPALNEESIHKEEPSISNEQLMKEAYKRSENADESIHNVESIQDEEPDLIEEPTQAREHETSMFENEPIVNEEPIISVGSSRNSSFVNPFIYTNEPVINSLVSVPEAKQSENNEIETFMSPPRRMRRYVAP